MNAREAFKFGFVARCVDDDVDPAVLAKQASTGWGALMDSIKDLGMLGGGLALAAPPIIGAAGGYTAGRLSGSMDDSDIEEVKKQELIDELRRQTARLSQARRRPATLSGGRRPMI